MVLTCGRCGKKYFLGVGEQRWLEQRSVRGAAAMFGCVGEHRTRPPRSQPQPDIITPLPTPPASISQEPKASRLHPSFSSAFPHPTPSRHLPRPPDCEAVGRSKPVRTIIHARAGKIRYPTSTKEGPLSILIPPPAQGIPLPYAHLGVDSASIKFDRFPAPRHPCS